MQQLIKDIIVYTKHFPSIEVIKQSIVDYNFENVVFCKNTKECVDSLTELKSAILMLDWEVGISEVMSVLEAASITSKIGVSPVFLFTRLEVPDFAGVVKEYHIGHMWIGELVKSVIIEAIVKFTNYPRLDSSSQESLTKYFEARKDERIDVAKTIIEDLYGKLPHNEMISCELAEFYLDLNDVKNASSVISQLSVDNVKSVRALNILGRCRLKENRHEDAIKYLSEAEVINPYNVQRLLLLGNTYLELGKVNLAELKFRSVLDLEAENKEAATGAASSLLALGDFNQAFDFINNLSGHGEIAAVFNTAAIVAIKDNRFDDAMNLYHMSAKTIGSDNPQLLAKIAFNMGLAHVKKQDHIKTYYYFCIAHKYDPSNEKISKNFNIMNDRYKSTPPVEIDKDLFVALLKYDTSQ